MHFTSCYVTRPRPELLVHVTDSKFFSARRSLGIAIKSDGTDNNDDVCECESNETRIFSAL